MTKSHANSRFCPNCGSCHRMPQNEPWRVFPNCSRRQDISCHGCGYPGHIKRYCWVVYRTANKTLTQADEQRLKKEGMREQQRRTREHDSYVPQYTNEKLRQPIKFVKQLDLPIFIPPRDDVSLASKSNFEAARLRQLLTPQPLKPEPVSLRILLRLAIGTSPYKRVITVVQGSSLSCASVKFMTELPAEIKIADPVCWLDVRGERAKIPKVGETFHFAKQVKLHELPNLSIAAVEINGRVECVVGEAWKAVDDVRIDWLNLEHDSITKIEDQHMAPPPPYESNSDNPIFIGSEDGEIPEVIML